MIENQDVPGIVGMLGTVLSKHSVNIANMSLSRNSVGEVAINICGLDSKPTDAAMKEIRDHQHIKRAVLVEL